MLRVKCFAIRLMANQVYFSFLLSLNIQPNLQYMIKDVILVPLYKSVHVSALRNSVTECGCNMFGATGNSGLICGVYTLLGLKRTFSCQRLLTLSSSRDFVLSWMQAAVLALVFRGWEREGGRVCVRLCLRV